MASLLRSIRPFIGAKDFHESRNFYKTIGFIETVLNPNLSLFSLQGICFYLQNAYVKAWVENTMLFIEVADIDKMWENLKLLELPRKFPGVRLLPIRIDSWGRECFLHDPAGILIHFGQFNQSD